MATVEGRECDEDTVCYRLFVNVPREKDVAEYLEEQRDIFLAFLGRFCMNYIWQQEPFNLRLRTATISTYYAAAVLCCTALPLPVRIINSTQLN